MPIFEGYCNNESCVSYKRQVEFLLKHYTDDNKPCPKCRQTVTRLVGKPNVIWAKPLGWYSGETDNKTGQKGDGHWVYETDEQGKKHQTYITSRQEQLDYCRRNGVVDPLENSRTSGLDDRGIDEAGKVNVWGGTPASLSQGMVKEDNWI